MRPLLKSLMPNPGRSLDHAKTSPLDGGSSAAMVSGVNGIRMFDPWMHKTRIARRLGPTGLRIFGFSGLNPPARGGRLRFSIGRLHAVG
jgi:hypothetical protein